ncbi:hypothetical protein JCM10212_005452 [Sporobolomyces blumeae]
MPLRIATRRICPSDLARSRPFSSSPPSRSPSPSPSPSPHLADRPYKIAIVGGGPAGFYTAGRLLALPGSQHVRVDLFELLPTPFGLARFGVAPDHPEVKNCEHKFEETARDPRFRFHGNVQVCGHDAGSSSTVVPNLSPSSLAAQVPLAALREAYDAVVLTYGASLDRPLGVAGEDSLSNVLSARTFVNWYNGHPYHSSLLAPVVDLAKTEHVTIVGQGNVALDVARVLLKDVDQLREFDVPEPVLAELARSRVKRVDVVGRRGPLHLAATTKELRELLALPGVAFETDQALVQDAIDVVERDGGRIEGARAKKRALALLQKGSKGAPLSPGSSEGKSWSLEFLKSPYELRPRVPAPTRAAAVEPTFASLADVHKIGSVVYTVNELVPSRSSPLDPSRSSARPTSRTVESRTDLVFKSVGYRSIGLPGLPFDEAKGVVRNVDGRVVDENETMLQGLYTSGWLSRGPTGVIATTMFNAFSTADLVASDLGHASHPRAKEVDVDREVVEKYRGGTKVVAWREWETLDRIERDRGRQRGKVREKVTSVQEMLELIA